MGRPTIIVFASGTKTNGGTGFENLAKSPELDVEITAVVSNHEHGGVRERADRLGIPFIYFDTANHSLIRANKRIVEKSEAAAYRRIVEETGVEWVALSGWLKFVHGLDPARTFNIHPVLLSFDHGRFGGPGMYGRRLHEAVKDALEKGEITESGMSMHFVTEEYDRGPIFFEYRAPLRKGMMPEEIAKLVKKAEHEWQPKITNMVVREEIRWDGKDSKSLVVPQGYKYLPKN